MSTETVFECPKCQKHGMVRLHHDGEIFECIYCRHTMDLSKPKKGGETGINVLEILLITLFAALIATTL